MYATPKMINMHTITKNHETHGLRLSILGKRNERKLTWCIYLCHPLFLGKEHNFNKYSHGKIDSLKQTYDLNSMLHYGSKYFSKNGKPTLRALGSNKDVKLGNTKSFSKTDIFEVNALYDCEGRTFLTVDVYL